MNVVSPLRANYPTYCKLDFCEIPCYICSIYFASLRHRSFLEHLIFRHLQFIFFLDGKWIKASKCLRTGKRYESGFSADVLLDNPLLHWTVTNLAEGTKLERQQVYCWRFPKDWNWREDNFIAWYSRRTPRHEDITNRVRKQESSSSESEIIISGHSICLDLFYS